MASVTIDGTHTKGGYVRKKLDLDTMVTTWTNAATSMITGYDHVDPSNDRYWWHGYASFDTSVLPDRCEITSLGYKNYIESNLSGYNPLDWRMLINMGTFLVSGGPDSGDWDAAPTLAGFIDWPTVPTDTTIPLVFNIDSINKTGYTDFEFIDVSFYGAPYNRWHSTWYDTSSKISQLVVNYRRLRSMVMVT